MNPRTWALATSLCLALAAPYPTGAQTPAKNPAPEKVLRYSFPVAETGFDPAQITDLYSAIVLANMLDALYEYDYLARPAKIKPNLAEAMPEVSPDFRTFTIKLRQGIYFADDPAFGGKKREADGAGLRLHVQALRRSEEQEPPLVEPGRGEGARPGRTAQEGRGHRASSTTTREVEGLRALDRYTIADQAGRDAPALHPDPGRPAASWASWRARWSRNTATRSWSTRWAPGPSCCRSGSAPPRSTLVRNPDLPREAVRRGAGRRTTQRRRPSPRG